MGYRVEILADSLSPQGVRLTTFLTTYPRFIHSEMLRHRMLSHLVASSRAIPTEKNIERVRTDPFIPSTFNARVKGMGVGDPLAEEEAALAKRHWVQASQDAVLAATRLNELGLDKSRANRLLEPFIWVDDIITGTDWENFFALRMDANAQPEFQVLAGMMREAMDTNAPWVVNEGEWHLPMTPDFPMDTFDGNWEPWKLTSAGRCARVSFDTHERIEDPQDGIQRAKRLKGNGHYSPFEVIARPFNADEWNAAENARGQYFDDCQQLGYKFDDNYADSFFYRGNLRGWVQMRKEIPNEARFDLVKEEIA
jgi:hypothetical protein